MYANNGNAANANNDNSNDSAQSVATRSLWAFVIHITNSYLSSIFKSSTHLNSINIEIIILVC